MGIVSVPHEHLARINTAELYPPFLTRVHVMLLACLRRGAAFYATRGRATMLEQEKLHRIALAGGPRAAPAGLSGHNYGIAIDFARDGDLDRKGLQPVWHSKDYAILGEETERAGLGWGGKFRDSPHVELLGFSGREELAPLALLWDLRRSDADNLREAWRYLDDHMDGLNA